MKIMLVDDHPAMRRVLKQLLEMSIPDRIEIMECESGEEAIEEYRTFLPDYILMDYQLKKLNGLETIAIMHENAPNATFIIVTSFDSSYLRKKAKNYKIAGFFSKENLSEIPKYLTNKHLN